MSEESLPEWYLWTLITALADGDDEAAAAMTTKAGSTANYIFSPAHQFCGASKAFGKPRGCAWMRSDCQRGRRMYKSVAASVPPTCSSSEDESSRSSSYCLFAMNSREDAFEKESDTVWLYLSGSKLSQKRMKPQKPSTCTPTL